MVLKLYVSLTSGNKEIKRQQEFIKQVLDTKKIEYEEVDISDPTTEEPKLFMRENGKPKEGQNVPLPPQVFSEQEYLGDFDAFHEANECDELYEFLKMAPQKNTSEAAITLAENAEQNGSDD